jgi:hypothetical protein
MIASLLGPEPNTVNASIIGRWKAAAYTHAPTDGPGSVAMLSLSHHRLDLFPAIVFSAGFLLSVIMIWSY